MAKNPGSGHTAPGEAEERRAPRWLRKLLSGTVGAAVLVAFGGLLLHAYGESQSSASGRTPVTIKADPGPFKVKPDSPGGRAVPDRDKRIYDRFAAAPPERSPERLLPPPEVPLPPPRFEPEPAPAPQALPALPATEPAQPEEREEPAASEKQTAAAKPPPALRAAQNYRLQLGALRSKAAVDDAWKRLRKRHRDLLSGLGLAIERTDLGPPKGVFYRLLAGPVGDRKKARRICADLQKRNVGCLVVTR